MRVGVALSILLLAGCGGQTTLGLPESFLLYRQADDGAARAGGDTLRVVEPVATDDERGADLRVHADLLFAGVGLETAPQDDSRGRGPR